jgi:hypothetical protein
MDKKSKQSATTKKLPKPQTIKIQSYYVSTSSYIDNKNKIEKHLEITSKSYNNKTKEKTHYIEKKNDKIKINLNDMDKIKRYLKKI